MTKPQKKKGWAIPTILRELRRVTLEATGYDIMEPHTDAMEVTELVGRLTTHHMNKQMEIPEQTSILMEDGEIVRPTDE